jgi:hypothetical protein
VRRGARVGKRGARERPRRATHGCVVGNHCTVSDGQSSACVSTTSYSSGAFFFHTLYSSAIDSSVSLAGRAGGLGRGGGA